MNILLTGGSGFLGKRILNKLFTKDYNVYAPRSTEMDLMDIESIKDLEEVFGEISGVIRQIHGVSLHVVYHDTEIYESSVLHNPSIADVMKEVKKIQGGGGTDFHHAYKWIKDNISDTDVIIHFTDGYDTFPKNRVHNIPTIVCLTHNGRDERDVESECGWVKVVKVSE